MRFRTDQDAGELNNSYTLSNVELWTMRGVRRAADVHVRDGRIVDILPSRSPHAGKGRPAAVLIPSGVDLQVHLRVPGQEHKETPESGLQAALRGGIGALLTMPNTRPTIDDLQSLKLGKERVAAAEARTGVRVLWSAAATVGQRGKELVEFQTLAGEGAIAAFTDDGRGVEDDSVMEKILAACAEVDRPFLQHAETAGAEGPLAPGPVQEALGLSPYHERHETEMVRRDLGLVRKHPGVRYHVLHVSSARTLDLVKSARAEGLKVTAEVTPHHLYFSSADIRVENTSYKMNPPLRGPDDRAALVRALGTGDLDWVATDHAPHEAMAKGLGFVDAPFGTLGLETSLPVLLELWNQGALSAARLVEVFSYAPAKYIGIDQEYGDIRVGGLARFALVDPWKHWTVQGSRSESISKNTCFDGAHLRGKVLGQATRSGLFLWKD